MKFCKNCTHLERLGLIDRLLHTSRKCLHPKASLGIDPSKHNGYMLAYAMRNTPIKSDRCGPEGKYFEAASTI
jgi:hypothetical protein